MHLPLLALALGIPLVLVAAKAHGRQLRLERELEGYHEVVFGGANPPFVEALWRRDRVRYWTLVPLVAAALAGALLLSGAGAWAYLALAPWPFVVGFVALGLVSLARLQGAMRTKEADPAWRRDAARGSLLWWGLALLLGAAAVAAWAW